TEWSRDGTLSTSRAGKARRSDREAGSRTRCLLRGGSQRSQRYSPRDRATQGRHPRTYVAASRQDVEAHLRLCCSTHYSLGCSASTKGIRRWLKRWIRLNASCVENQSSFDRRSTQLVQ